MNERPTKFTIIHSLFLLWALVVPAIAFSTPIKLELLSNRVCDVPWAYHLLFSDTFGGEDPWISKDNLQMMRNSLIKARLKARGQGKSDFSIRYELTFDKDPGVENLEWYLAQNGLAFESKGLDRIFFRVSTQIQEIYALDMVMQLYETNPEIIGYTILNDGDPSH